MVPWTSQGLAAQPLSNSGYRGKNAWDWLLILGVGVAHIAHGRKEREDGGVRESMGGKGDWRERFSNIVLSHVVVTSCVLLWLSC